MNIFLKLFFNLIYLAIYFVPMLFNFNIKKKRVKNMNKIKEKTT